MVEPLNLEGDLDRELSLTRNVGTTWISQTIEDLAVQVVAHPAMLHRLQSQHLAIAPVVLAGGDIKTRNLTGRICRCHECRAFACGNRNQGTA